MFSCSNTETKPTTGLSEEEGRSESHPICGVWEVTAQSAACLAEGLIPVKSAAISKLVLFVSDLNQGNLNQIITLEDFFLVVFSL